MDVTTMVGIGLFTLVAGMLGSMLGLGGGVFIVPVLSLFFGVPLKTAIAASAVAVVANSVVGSTGHLRSGFTNLNLAMLMEVATTIGALGGGLVAGCAAGGVRCRPAIRRLCHAAPLCRH